MTVHAKTVVNIRPSDGPKRPYIITITSGADTIVETEWEKRAAKPLAKRLLREHAKAGATADVTLEEFGLVYQMEMYEDANGKLKIRDVEL